MFEDIFDMKPFAREVEDDPVETESEECCGGKEDDCCVCEDDCDCNEDDECNCGGCGHSLKVGDVFLFTTTPNITLLSRGLFAPDHRILMWKKSETRYEILSGSGWFTPARDDMSVMFSYLISDFAHFCNIERIYNISDHIDGIELKIFKTLCGGIL